MAKKKSDKAGDGKTTVAPPAIKAMKAMKAMKTVEIEDTLTLTARNSLTESLNRCFRALRAHAMPVPGHNAIMRGTL